MTPVFLFPNSTFPEPQGDPLFYAAGAWQNCGNEPEETITIVISDPYLNLSQYMTDGQK